MRHAPVFGDASAVARSDGPLDLYRDVLERSAARLVAAIDAIASAGALPALVFCSAGKDRTGMVVALALSTVGVTDDDIVREYLLTDRVYHGAFRESVVRRAREAGFVRQRRAAQEMPAAHAMRAVLGDLASLHGGAAAYLTGNGLAPERLSALRTALVVWPEPTRGSVRPGSRRAGAVLPDAPSPSR